MCLAEGNDDTPLASPFDCTTLPFSGADCSGFQARGDFYCDQANKHLRAEVAESVHTCLQSITETDHCSQAHDDAADACFFDDGTFLACPTPPLFDSVNMMDFGCQQMAEQCPNGNLTQDACEGTAFGYTLTAQAAIFNCYVDSIFGNCDTKDPIEEFSLCVTTAPDDPM